MGGSLVRDRQEPPRSTLRPELREPAPAVVTRRPVAPGLAAASSRDGQMSLPVRDRITFPSSHESDWDVPAFQRRQSG